MPNINQDKYHQKLEENERITLLARVKTQGAPIPEVKPPNSPNMDLFIAENAKLSKEISRLREENKNLKLAVEDVTAKYADAIQNGEKLLDDCDEYKAKLEDRENVIADLQKKNKEFTKEITKLKKAVEALSKE